MQHIFNALALKASIKCIENQRMTGDVNLQQT